MQTATIALILAAMARPALPEIGVCDPDGGPRIRWTAEQKAEVKRRARAACKAQGAAPFICGWIDASRVRESSGSPSVRHRRGVGEDGVGILGLDMRAHRDKWPGDPEPAFCLPEASVLVALDIARRAVVKWGAVDVSDIQATFAFRTFRDEDGKLHVAKDRGADRRLCAAMSARGFDCHTPVSLKDLGRRTPVADRPARAAELAGR